MQSDFGLSLGFEVKAAPADPPRRPGKLVLLFGLVSVTAATTLAGVLFYLDCDLDETLGGLHESICAVNKRISVLVLVLAQYAVVRWWLWERSSKGPRFYWVGPLLVLAFCLQMLGVVVIFENG